MRYQIYDWVFAKSLQRKHHVENKDHILTAEYQEESKAQNEVQYNPFILREFRSAIGVTTGLPPPPFEKFFWG